MARSRPVDARRGESDAVRYLEQHGYRIVARNFTCPIGELDIVALCDGVLTFVEVKARSGTRADPEEAVNSAKQRKLVLVAEYFMRTHKLAHKPFRFDVVAISYSAAGEASIQHFPDAFEPA